MSDIAIATNTLWWLFWGLVAAAVVNALLISLNKRLNRQWDEMTREFLRSELDALPDIVRIVEDLQRSSPQIAEPLEVARLNLVSRRDTFRKLLAKVEKRAAREASKKWWQA